MNHVSIKIILNIACSRDHFIADATGGIDWLPTVNEHGEDCGMTEFIDSVDTILIGNNTYEQMLTFGEWPFPGKLSYIFSNNHNLKSDRPDIIITHDEIPVFMQKIRDERRSRRMWLLGGAALARSFDLLNLIDEAIITVIPVTLGAGIALTVNVDRVDRWQLVDTRTYKNDIVQNHYHRINKL